MPKLPKKSTMIDTIGRVKGYASKLFQSGKISTKQYTETIETLNKLETQVKK